MTFVDRTYRSFIATERFVPFRVSWKETDLYIKARANLSEKAETAVHFHRGQIEAYIRKKPLFKTSLEPLESDRDAAPIIQDMLQAAQSAGVGPMAAVAGAIAEYVGRELLPLSPEVIIENGGDIFLVLEKPVVVGLFAGDSPYTNRLGVRILAEHTPCGVCTSSGTVGPSLSFGKADAACVWAASTALADAAATAIGNLVKQPEDIDYALEKGKEITGIMGVIIVAQNRIGIWGPMELVKLGSEE